MKKKSSPPVFKEYTQGQVMLLPTDLEAQIPPKHLVRVVNTAIEKMNLARLLPRGEGENVTDGRMSPRNRPYSSANAGFQVAPMPTW